MRSAKVPLSLFGQVRARSAGTEKHLLREPWQSVAYIQYETNSWHALLSARAFDR